MPLTGVVSSTCTTTYDEKWENDAQYEAMVYQGNAFVQIQETNRIFLLPFPPFLPLLYKCIGHHQNISECCQFHQPFSQASCCVCCLSLMFTATTKASTACKISVILFCYLLSCFIRYFEVYAMIPKTDLAT